MLVGMDGVRTSITHDAQNMAAEGMQGAAIALHCQAAEAAETVAAANVATVPRSPRLNRLAGRSE